VAVPRLADDAEDDGGGKPGEDFFGKGGGFHLAYRARMKGKNRHNSVDLVLPFQPLYRR
jgi:hypothetical protein